MKWIKYNPMNLSFNHVKFWIKSKNKIKTTISTGVGDCAHSPSLMTTNSDTMYCTGTIVSPNNCNRISTCWNPLNGTVANTPCANNQWTCVVTINFFKF